MCDQLARAAAVSIVCLALAGCNTAGQLATESAAAPENSRLAHLAADVEARGDYDTAAALYAQAAQTSGHAPDIQLRLGNAYLKTGEHAGAQQAFGKVLAGEPGNLEALVGFGTTQLRRGDLEGGARTLSTACPQVNTPTACNRLGTSLIMLGRLDAALEAFERARSLAPDDVDIKVNIALTQALSGRTDESVDVMQAIVQSPLAQPRHRANLVMVLGIARRLDEAKAVHLPDMTEAQKRALLARAKKAGEAPTPLAKARAIGLLTAA